MIRFVCISDLHLDAATYGVARMNEIDRSVRAQLEKVRKGDEVVFLGDLGNPGSSRIYEAISRAIQYDREVRNRGACMHWLVGNHDVLEDGSGGSVLEPLRGYGAEVYSLPDGVVASAGGVDMIFLPHAPLASRYDPGEFLRRRVREDRPTIVFGHLNPPGITPGSEAEAFARGRDVMWPEDRPVARNVLYVSGHIHRAQEYPKRPRPDVRPWGSIQIVGAPVRFGFDEADHEPQTFVASWDGEDWQITREPVEKNLLKGGWLSRFVTVEENDRKTMIGEEDFVRSSDDLSELCDAAGATFVPLPKLAVARPKARVEEGARRHRRVRDVVSSIAKAYPTADAGLESAVETIMTENQL